LARQGRCWNLEDLREKVPRKPPLHSPPAIKRILIYRIGSLGDTIVALPCFHLIERLYPNAERILLTNFPVHVKAPAAASVLEHSRLINGYMRYNIGTRNPLELSRVALEIRRFKPDVLVYLMPVRSQHAVRRNKRFFQLAAGVEHIVGLPDSEQLNRERGHASGLYESEAVRLARSLSDWGDADAGNAANWDLRLTAFEKDTARAAVGDLAGRPLMACGPGTKMQSKDWGSDNWRALLAKLSLRFPSYGLVLVGAKEDTEVGDYASRDWHGPIVNLCGRVTPRETAAVLEQASVFLGPDSGPMHLAACVATPCVIAFSARGLPGVWYPAGQGHQILYRHVSCSGCNLETCIAEARRCLTSITVDEMAAAVHSVLSKRMAEHNE
jgi:heptosyltransferase III